MLECNMQIDRNHPHVVKQDTQCTYNVKIRRIHATTVVVEKQCMLHTCVFRLCLA